MMNSKEYIINTTALIPQDEVWSGCSDIIESVFGRVKSYAKNAPFKEITRARSTVYLMPFA